MTITDIVIEHLRIDGNTQPRAVMRRETIDDYSDAMRGGAVFPPVVLFHDGNDYWLADGFHRLAAARQAGLVSIAADVREGTVRDAQLHSFGANSTHGDRRTNDDKRRAVTAMLKDEEWRAWNDSEIARRCGVSQPFVGKIRALLITIISTNDAPANHASTRQYTRKGKTQTMDTTNVGTKGTAAKPRPTAVAQRAPVVHETRVVRNYTADAELRQAFNEAMRTVRTVLLSLDPGAVMEVVPASDMGVVEAFCTECRIWLEQCQAASRIRVVG